MSKRSSITPPTVAGPMVRTRDGSRRLGYQTPKPPSRLGVPQHHPAKEDSWPTLPGGHVSAIETPIPPRPSS
jgi:hypothetical protein